jgi:hypothetical protein
MREQAGTRDNDTVSVGVRGVLANHCAGATVHCELLSPACRPVPRSGAGAVAVGRVDGGPGAGLLRPAGPAPHPHGRSVAQARGDARSRIGAGADDGGEALFTYTDGRAVRPEYLSHRFRKLIKALDLPPIRPHDLRHGAASLALAARTDLKVIQQMLGHSSIIITTVDTYAGVRPELAHSTAQASADLIMQVARSGPASHSQGRRLPAGIEATARALEVRWL